MHVVQFGLSHDVAPIATRERVAFSGREVPEALAGLLGCEEIAEAAILSTCNRTELYAACYNAWRVRDVFTEFLSRRCGLLPAEIAETFVWREDESAAAHLFRVAAGLESQILGEGQILGQVREAAQIARDAGALGPLLDALFRHAVGAGKRVRSETPLSQGAVSVGSAAVELAKESLGGLAGRSTLLVGAGKLGELALKHLASQGVRRIVVANRTLESAEELAKVVGGEAIPFISLRHALGEVDVVLCCTGAPHYVLAAPEFEGIMAERADRPLVVVDVSVPRNIDPAVGDLPGVRLYDIDHLAAVTERSRDERAFLVPAVEAILDGERGSWEAFLRSYQAAPTITGLRQKVEALRVAELEAFLHQVGETLTPEQLAAVERLSRSLAARFLHDPTVGLRAKGDGQHGVHAAAIRELFGLAAPARSGRRSRAIKR